MKAKIIRLFQFIYAFGFTIANFINKNEFKLDSYEKSLREAEKKTRGK